MCFVYTVLACANLGIQDALLAAGNVKTAVIFDLLTILIQIASLLFFVKIAQTSLIVSVFISFIFSYSLISFASATILINAFPTQRSLLNTGARSMLMQSKKQILFGIASGLVDRVDRFLIGLILPIAFLHFLILIVKPPNTQVSISQLPFQFLLRSNGRIPSE